MLKLSTKGQYGVRAMFEISRGYPDGPVAIKEIAARQDVSVAYLEQILNTLRKSGLITSVRGPGGGYLLSRRPEEISIGEILRGLDGPIALTACQDPMGGCVRADGCVTSLLWKALGEKIEGFLDAMTLQDLLAGKSKKQKQKNLSAPRHASDEAQKRDDEAQKPGREFFERTGKVGA